MNRDGISLGGILGWVFLVSGLIAAGALLALADSSMLGARALAHESLLYQLLSYYALVCVVLGGALLLWSSVGHEVPSTVRWASVAGILTAGALGYALWTSSAWAPNADRVHSLLLGTIQTQAGILAISMSFSLLYVQVSVDAYSLRAAKILLRQEAFRQMTEYYVVSLVICSLLALLVGFESESDHALVSLVSGVAGMTLFLHGLVVIVAYIYSITEAIVPEAIIRELTDGLSGEPIRKESLRAALDKQTGRRPGHTRAPPMTEAERRRRAVFEDGVPTYWGEELEHVHIAMPIGINELSEVSDALRMLIDIAKRMVHRSDHTAAKAAINAITGLYGSGWLLSAPPRSDSSEDWGAYRREKEITSAALLAYLAGALMEIWTTAVKLEDRDAAFLLTDAMGKLLGPDVMSRDVARTDVVRVAVYERMFQDAGRREWLDVRRQVIQLLTERLEGIAKYDKEEAHPRAHGVYRVLKQMGDHLLTEESLDDIAEGEVLEGLREFGRYGASVGHGTIISGISFYLEERASRNAPYYPGAFKFLMEIGDTWVRGTPEREYEQSDFWTLLTHGVVQVVAKYNEQETRRLHPRPSAANEQLLDVLQDIAVACIESRRWEYLRITLRKMNQLVTEPEHTPGRAALCLAEVLWSALMKPQTEAICIWVQAVANGFLNRYQNFDPEMARSELARAELVEASDWLLRAIHSARANEAVVADTNLRGSLAKLSHRLEHAHTAPGEALETMVPPKDEQEEQ